MALDKSMPAAYPVRPERTPYGDSSASGPIPFTMIAERRLGINVCQEFLPETYDYCRQALIHRPASNGRPRAPEEPVQRTARLSRG